MNQILKSVSRTIKGIKYATKRFIHGGLDPVFIYRGESKVKDIPGKDPTFEECIQYVKNLYKIERYDLTIGFEIKGHAVYTGRVFTDLRKNGMKFVIKNGTKMSNIGKFLSFDFNNEINNINNPYIQVKVLVGLELYYEAETFLDDLGKELSSMVPKNFIASSGPNIGSIKQESFSQLLGQIKSHIKNKYKVIRNENPDYKFSIETLAEYLGNLRLSKDISNSNINEKILPLFRKFIKYNDCPLSSNGFLRNNPKFKKHYFKHVNTHEKAYWLGWIFAEGNLYRIKSNKQVEFTISCDLGDAALMKRFIECLGINPQKVKKKVRYRMTDNDGNRIELKKEGSKYYHYDSDGGKSEINKSNVIISREFNLKLKNKEFTNNLEATGLQIGKSSDKIKFPQLKNRELQLAFLLGFFDGDGYLELDDSRNAKRAVVNSVSKEFLENIKKIFNLEENPSPKAEKKRKDGTISKNYRLSLRGDIYNEMMSLPLKSLVRKRNLFPTERIEHQITRKREGKMMFSYEKLKKLSSKYTYSQMAELHKKEFGIEIDPGTIGYHIRKLRNSKTNIL